MEGPRRPRRSWATRRPRSARSSTGRSAELGSVGRDGARCGRRAGWPRQPGNRMLLRAVPALPAPAPRPSRAGPRRQGLRARRCRGAWRGGLRRRRGGRIDNASMAKGRGAGDGAGNEHRAHHRERDDGPRFLRIARADGRRAGQRRRVGAIYGRSALDPLSLLSGVRRRCDGEAPARARRGPHGPPELGRTNRLDALRLEPSDQRVTKELGRLEPFVGICLDRLDDDRDEAGIEIRAKLERVRARRERES